MPASITRKNQNVINYIEKWRDKGVFKERTFSDNTQVEVNTDGSFKIWLFSTKIVEFISSRNEYIIKNGGWRSRTTAHDIRAYLRLLLNYDFRDWEIYRTATNTIHCENEEINCGRGVIYGRKWTFNPTALIFNWDEDGE